MPQVNTGTNRPSNVTAQNKRVTGISFPFRKENGQFPAIEQDADCVRNDLLSLFNTALTSRVMRPAFGHNAYDAVFEAQGALLNAILQRIVRQTISNHEPRVNVRNVTIEEVDTRVDVFVDYDVQGVPETLQVLSIPKT